jgi:hypothetical protein
MTASGLPILDLMRLVVKPLSAISSLL